MAAPPAQNLGGLHQPQSVSLDPLEPLSIHRLRHLSETVIHCVGVNRSLKRQSGKHSPLTGLPQVNVTGLKSNKSCEYRTQLMPRHSGTAQLIRNVSFCYLVIAPA